MKACVGALGFVLFAACSSASSSTAGGPVTVEQACAEYADRRCELEQMCEPGWFDLEWGDMANCKAGMPLGCAEGFTAAGVKDTPERMAACARELAMLSCDQYFRPRPDVCRPSLGTLPDGAACGLRTQCQGGACRGRLRACGTCITAVPEGGPCALFHECADGLDCVEGLCTRLNTVERGGQCDLDHACAGTLACVGGGAVGPGTCAPPLPAGATCDSNNQVGNDCDFTKGLACAGEMSTCYPVPKLRAVGETCSGNSCNGKAYCDFNDTCSPRQHAGGSCVDSDQCLLPLNCVGGVCAVFDPATCQ
jgi:hypothetical protein